MKKRVELKCVKSVGPCNDIIQSLLLVVGVQLYVSVRRIKMKGTFLLLGHAPLSTKMSLWFLCSYRNKRVFATATPRRLIYIYFPHRAFARERTYEPIGQPIVSYYTYMYVSFQVKRVIVLTSRNTKEKDSFDMIMLCLIRQRTLHSIYDMVCIMLYVSYVYGSGFKTI